MDTAEHKLSAPFEMEVLGSHRQKPKEIARKSKKKKVFLPSINFIRIKGS